MRKPVLWVLLAGCVQAAPQGDQNAQWIYFTSRETETPPKLELVLADGKTAEMAADADSVLISYLPDRAFGGMASLSVSLGDTNRVLLRFPVEAGPPVAKAYLVLGMKLSEIPPRSPFGIALHELSESWTESAATWKGQPAFGNDPAGKVQLEPKEQQVRLDVTESVNGWRKASEENHGWLLKSAGPPFDLARALIAQIPWAASAEAAKAAAVREKKEVLAVVRATYRPDEPCFTEQTLLAIVMADPDVRTLILARFVPVRIACSPNTHLFPGGDDPLTALGTASVRTKPLAIVVADARGRHLGTLQGIGTFAPGLFLRFLHSVLPKKGLPEGAGAWALLARGEINRARAAFKRLSPLEGTYGLARVAALEDDHELVLKTLALLLDAKGPWGERARSLQAVALLRLGRWKEARQAFESARENQDPEMAPVNAYWLACLLHRAREIDRARELWSGIAKDDPAAPFALKAHARLLWTDRMATEEVLAATALAGGTATTEYACSPSDARSLIGDAVEYLLSQQRPDGTWPNLQIPDYDGAVTAIVARSLLLLKPDTVQEPAGRIRSAVSAATRWLSRWIREADPATTNSFSAAYALDFLVDASARDENLKSDAQRAVRLLEGGQCPDGAWSYSRLFGTTWKGGFGGWPVTERGRTHSMNTGLSLLALARAQAAGLRVDAAALDRGARTLLAMRKSPGAFTYTWPEPVNFNAPETSLGRASLCEHALLLLGRTMREDLESALDAFMRGRAELRKPVKLTESWVPPAAASSYFYAFAWHHAARALAHLGGESSRTRLSRLRTDLLQVVETDCTWVDFDQVGKPYATAMALSVLTL